jgi:hypothetical protein
MHDGGLANIVTKFNNLTHRAISTSMSSQIVKNMNLNHVECSIYPLVPVKSIYASSPLIADIRPDHQVKYLSPLGSDQEFPWQKVESISKY